MRPICVAALLIMFLSPLGAHDDKEFVLKKKIAEIKNKIEKIKKKQSETDKEISRFIKTHSGRIARRKEEIDRIKRDLLKLKTDFRREKSVLIGLNNELKSRKLRQKMLKNMLLKKMKEYRQFIERGFPCKKEQRLEQISRMITDMHFDAAMPGEIFNRFYGFLNKELMTGFDSEVYLKGNAGYLRIGRVILAYSDPEGAECGILIRKKGKWKWETDLEYRYRKAIRDSVMMVQGKKAPAVMEFPFPLSLLREYSRRSGK